METYNRYTDEEDKKRRRKRGFFFLLGVGAVAAVAIPLISVKACSSTKHEEHIEYGKFTQEADQYRGLNIVSYSWKIPGFGWGVSVARLNSAAKWYSPTEIKVAPDKISGYAPYPEENVFLYKELQKLHDQTIKKIDTMATSLTHKPIIAEIRKVIETFWNEANVSHQLYGGDVDQWYQATCAAINAQLDKVFKHFDNESPDYARLEYVHSQGGFKPLNGISLSADEKEIYEFALPMLMKVAKTRAAAGAIAPKPASTTPIEPPKLYAYSSSTFKNYVDFKSLGDEFHNFKLYDEQKNGVAVVEKAISNPEWASSSEMKRVPTKSEVYNPSATEKTAMEKSLGDLYSRTLTKVKSIPVTNMHPDQIDAILASIETFGKTTYSTKAEYDAAYKTLVDSTNAQTKIMFFDLKPSKPDKSEFEYLFSDGGFETVGDQMVTGHEKEIFQEGIPLLIKAAKLKALIHIL